MKSRLRVPLFDSLAHPTLTGKWWGRDCLDASFATLSKELAVAGFSGACAVGLAGVEGYSHSRFISECSKFPNLVPVAGIDPRVVLQKPKLFRELAETGYKGVKIHPRYSQWEPEADTLGEVFRGASLAGLVSFYCTYQFCSALSMPREDPFFVLARAIQYAQGSKIILVHGGAVELLRYAEFVRFNENLLLDLSLTLMKYQGSSIDWDIRFLFSHFDRRVCIGSDHPEYKHEDVAHRFFEIGEDLPIAKLRNIASRNITAFLSLDS